MQQMLHTFVLYNPFCADGKPPTLPAGSSFQKSSLSQQTGSYQRMASGPQACWPSKVGDVFSPRAWVCCSMKRPCYRPRMWTLQFKSLAQKSPGVLRMCHADMEIVSVKELADGSLHFSFRGAPNLASSSKGNELSSFHGEHAGNLVISKRLPSRFRKQSPIPVVAARQKKKQEESQPIQEADDASTPAHSREVIKPSLRPKSSFVKRSPIPKRKNVLSGLLKAEVAHVTNSVVNHSNNSSLFNVKPTEGPSEVKKVHFSQRRVVVKEVPTSGRSRRFVRKSPAQKSPAPAPTAAPALAHPPALSEPELLPNVMAGVDPKPAGKHVAAQHLRPKSKFTRRSPIEKVDMQAAQKIIPEESSQEPSNEALKKLDVSSHTDLTSISKANGSWDEPALGSSEKLPGEFSGHKGAKRLDGRSQNELASVAKGNGSLGETTGKSLDLETQSGNTLDFLSPSDLRKYKLVELKNIAKSRGLKGYSKLKKEELLDLLSYKE